MENFVLVTSIRSYNTAAFANLNEILNLKCTVASSKSKKKTV
jgi:hypothetical protein